MSWSRTIKNVRRHACSSFIKICRDFPQFILVIVPHASNVKQQIRLVVDYALGFAPVLHAPVNNHDSLAFFFSFSSSLILTCSTTTWRICLQVTPRCRRWRSVHWWSPWFSSVTSLKTLIKRRLFWMNWCPPWLRSGRRRKWRRVYWLPFPLPFSFILLKYSVWCLMNVLQRAVWPCCVPVLRRSWSSGHRKEWQYRHSRPQSIKSKWTEQPFMSRYLQYYDAMKTNWAFCCTVPDDVRLVSHVCNGEAVSVACRPGRSQSWWICGWLYPCWGSHLQKPRRCPLSVLLAQFLGFYQVKKWHDMNSCWFKVQWQKITFVFFLNIS